MPTVQTTTLTEMRDELMLRHAEKEKLDATIGSCRADLRSKDAEILQNQTDLASAQHEREDISRTLNESHIRIQTVVDAQVGAVHTLARTPTPSSSSSSASASSASSSSSFPRRK